MRLKAWKNYWLSDFKIQKHQESVQRSGAQREEEEAVDPRFIRNC